MVTYKYNKPYYEIQFSELQNEVINVLSFEGKRKFPIYLNIRSE